MGVDGQRRRALKLTIAHQTGQLCVTGPGQPLREIRPLTPAHALPDVWQQVARSNCQRPSAWPRHRAHLFASLGPHNKAAAGRRAGGVGMTA